MREVITGSDTVIVILERVVSLFPMWWTTSHLWLCSLVLGPRNYPNKMGAFWGGKVSKQKDNKMYPVHSRVPVYRIDEADPSWCKERSYQTLTLLFNTLKTVLDAYLSVYWLSLIGEPSSLRSPKDAVSLALIWPWGLLLIFRWKDKQQYHWVPGFTAGCSHTGSVGSQPRVFFWILKASSLN